MAENAEAAALLLSVDPVDLMMGAQDMYIAGVARSAGGSRGS